MVWSGVDGSCGPATDWGLLSSVVVPMSGNDGVPRRGVDGGVPPSAAFGTRTSWAWRSSRGSPAASWRRPSCWTVLERTAAPLPHARRAPSGHRRDGLRPGAVPPGRRRTGHRLWRYGNATSRRSIPARYRVAGGAGRSWSRSIGRARSTGTLEYHSVRRRARLPRRRCADTQPRRRGRSTPGDCHRRHRRARPTEARERTAEDRYRTAFEEGPVGMARTALDGRFEAVNEALCELTGYTAEQLCASDFARRSPTATTSSGRDRPGVNGRRPDRRVSRPRSGFSTPTGTTSGSPLSTAIVRDDDDRPLYFLSHYLDITDRKRFEITAPPPRRTRSDDRAGQTGAASKSTLSRHGRDRRSARAIGRAARAGSRPFQADQRHARSSRRRRADGVTCACPASPCPVDRRHRQARRGRVRGDAAIRDPRAGRRDGGESARRRSVRGHRARRKQSTQGDDQHRRRDVRRARPRVVRTCWSTPISPCTTPRRLGATGTRSTKPSATQPVDQRSPRVGRPDHRGPRPGQVHPVRPTDHASRLAEDHTPRTAAQDDRRGRTRSSVRRRSSALPRSSD